MTLDDSVLCKANGVKLTLKESARDKRLRKKYAWTFGQVEDLAHLQDNRCGICGREAKDAPLNVDHFHFKVTVWRSYFAESGHKWCAQVRELQRPVFYGKTQKEARKLAYQDALPHSVRGLLCPGRHRGCNRLLGRVDSIEWLEKALAYLKDPPARKITQLL